MNTDGTSNARLFVRILIATLILLAVIGPGVYLHEMNMVENYAAELAREDAVELLPHVRAYLLEKDPSHHNHIKAILEELLHKGHFVHAEIFDSAKRSVLSLTVPEKGEAVASIRRLAGAPGLGGSAPRSFTIRKTRYLTIESPIDDGTKKPVGFFEGIYEIDRHTENNLSSHITSTLIIAIISILITAATIYPIIASMNRRLVRLNLDIVQSNIGILEALGSAVSKRDSDTSEHNYRVTIYAIRLGETIGITSDQMAGLIKGAFLHDVGKIAIGDSILLKPGKLSDDEFSVMKTHVTHGADIIEKYRWLSDALDVVLYHHERFDGKGYPRGFSGNDIPLLARVFSVVDVFDALTSLRHYKEPFGYDRSMAIISEGSGIWFDPEVVAAFSSISKELYETVRDLDGPRLSTMLAELIRRHRL